MHTIAVFMYPVEVKLALTTTSANANSGCTKDPLLATQDPQQCTLSQPTLPISSYMHHYNILKNSHPHSLGYKSENQRMEPTVKKLNLHFVHIIRNLTPVNPLSVRPYVRLSAKSTCQPEGLFSTALQLKVAGTEQDKHWLSIISDHNCRDN